VGNCPLANQSFKIELYKIYYFCKKNIMSTSNISNNLNENLFTKFKLVAFLEGCSFLAFAITMPLKYKLDILWPNKYVGMAHGVLFILYCVMLVIVAYKFKWGFAKITLSFLAAWLPFGTFIAAKKVYPTSVA
jgi:integral membrane protein